MSFVPTSIRPLRLLFAGHSHLRCVRAAAQEGAAELARAHIEVDVLTLNQPHTEPHFTLSGAGRPGALHPALERDLLARSAAADAVYLSIGGSAHDSFGLVEHARPWDFVLEEEPELPVLPGRDMLPGGLVRAAFRATQPFCHQSELRTFLPAVIARPLAQIESPPPARRASQLQANPGCYRELIRERGVAPASLRHKLWRLHSHLVMEDCRAAGIEFIPVARAAHDGDGFLPEAALGTDPTHANTWYGRRVIEQIVRRHRQDFAFVDGLVTEGALA